MRGVGYAATHPSKAHDWLLGSELLSRGVTQRVCQALSGLLGASDVVTYDVVNALRVRRRALATPPSNRSFKCQRFVGLTTELTFELCIRLVSALRMHALHVDVDHTCRRICRVQTHLLSVDAHVEC